MNSTDAEDRLPIRSKESQVSDRASSGRPKAPCSAASTFGPPGWHTHHSTSARASPCEDKNASTSAPTYDDTSEGTSAPSTILSPVAPTSHPIARNVSA